MGRTPCCEKTGLKKGPWTPEEDQKLISFIQEHGHGSWRALPAKAGLRRCGKSCRLRWTNYLRPDIKRGKFSLQEEQTIIQLHALLGNRWSTIASHLPKRTDNEIKNYWNTHLKKRLMRMGIDPITHKPKMEGSNNLSHMAQWESARLEAEARLVRESNFQQQTQQSTNNTNPTRLVLNKMTPQRPPLLPPCLDVIKAWQNKNSTDSTINSYDRNKPMMHSMYAMMLSNNDLDSPTSTLSFPENSHPMSMTLLTNTIGLMNDNSSLKEDQEKMYNETTSSWFQDHDDIMVAVEAFRGVGYCDDNNNNNNVTLSAPFSIDGDDDIVPVFNSVENLAAENGGNNLEENKNYWSSILHVVEDSMVGSPVF